MLKYIDSEKYKRDPHIVHYLLIGLCIVIIVSGVLIYFT